MNRKDSLKNKCHVKEYILIFAVPPTSVSQVGLGVVIEGVQHTIECGVSSVYKGQDVTEFSIRVGDSKLRSGTKSQTTGSVSGTYNVKYTQAVTFIYSQHQGQKVQCEVTWMDGTSVETVRISAEITLDIYGIYMNASQIICTIHRSECK